MNRLSRSTLVVVCAVVAGFVALPVSAVGRPAGVGAEGVVHAEAASTKLADTKLRACQNREKAINNIMARIADRGQKQLNLFTNIATRTETFYINKGKVLSNYDTLVADVNAKRAAAQTRINTIKSDAVSFKCDGTDPKGAAASFKTDLKAEITALKNYKTAVKNLIVGVKSVQGTTSSSTNSTSGGR